jgi:hypothetical protein
MPRVGIAVTVTALRRASIGATSSVTAIGASGLHDRADGALVDEDGVARSTDAADEQPANASATT